MDVWLCYCEGGSYDDYHKDIIGICASRALAKARCLSWAEKEARSWVKDGPKYPESDRLAYYRHQYGLDDYRWFDSRNKSRWFPQDKPVRVVDAKGNVTTNLDEIDFRHDYLYAVRWTLEE